MNEVLTQDEVQAEVMEILDDLVATYGTVTAAAKSLEYSYTIFSLYRNGKRPPSKELLERLGFEICYRRRA